MKIQKNGDAGDRTPCLSHAKRALYHLSYIPILMLFLRFIICTYYKVDVNLCRTLHGQSYFF
ncbi:transmembrane protein, putative [Medicago truncatula]|uniref:Transmembrane protein, putative n=1 Tax=Medicago truncatula TaxID=3880 RepID=G7KKZ2_MEDTR|nr:transmembrane protein, putative [Medicago truncatula]